MFGSLFKKKETQQPMPVMRAPATAPSKPVTPKKPVKAEKSRYLCNACGYRFGRMAHIEFNSICPYCGKKGVVEDHTADAQKLIDATKHMDEDRFFPSR